MPTGHTQDPSLITACVLGVVTMGPWATIILRGLIRPGRKGDMRTSRELVAAERDPRVLAQIYIQRLQFEGFRIQSSSRPWVWDLKRPSQNRKKGSGPLALLTHANKELKGTLSLRPMESGTQVLLTLWMTSYIFQDTGEGQYLDLMLERLLEGELADQRPMVPNPSMKATWALHSGVMMLLVPFVLLIPGLGPPGVRDFIAGFTPAGFATIVLGSIGILDTLRRPKELTGRKGAALGIAFALAGFLLAVVLILVVLGYSAQDLKTWILK